MDLLGGLRSIMEGERELLFYFEPLGMNRSQKRDVGEEEDGYKYPLSPNGHLSHGSVMAQVRQCRTRQDSKGKSEVLAIFAVNLRMHV